MKEFRVEKGHYILKLDEVLKESPEVCGITLTPVNGYTISIEFTNAEREIVKEHHFFVCGAPYHMQSLLETKKLCNAWINFLHRNVEHPEEFLKQCKDKEIAYRAELDQDRKKMEEMENKRALRKKAKREMQDRMNEKFYEEHGVYPWEVMTY